MGANGQLSGIWLGLWASASGGAAQSISMFSIACTRRCQKGPSSAASLLGARWQPQLGCWRHHRRRAPALAYVRALKFYVGASSTTEIAAGSAFSSVELTGVFPLSIRGNASSNYRTPAVHRAGPPPRTKRNSGCWYSKKIKIRAIHRASSTAQQIQKNSEKDVPQDHSRSAISESAPSSAAQVHADLHI